MRIRVSFSPALLISVVLHTLLLISIEPDFKIPTFQQREPVVFTLIPQRSSQKNEEIARQPRSTNQTKTRLKPTPGASSLPVTQLETPQASNSKVTTPKSETITASPLEITARSVKSLVVTSDIEAFEAYSTTKCEVSPKASLARRCKSTGEPSIAEAPKLLGDLFQDLSSTNPTFKRDMDTIELLVEQAANLQALVSSDPTQLALVAEQKRHIREEIRRIDNSHRQANLLKLIPEATRIVRGLKENYGASK